MERMSRQSMFMAMAEVAAMRATCFRGNIGALVVMANDIVAMGYNGPAPGEEHCRGNSCDLVNGGCHRSVHAERNALNRATKKLGTSLTECDLYTTYSPCPSCAEWTISRGIRRVFYRYPYRLTSGLDDLKGEGVAVYRVTPAGFIIEEGTGLMVAPEELS